MSNTLPSDTNADSTSNPNVNCLQGMKCPDCGSFGPFKILVSSVAFCTVTDDGLEFVGGDTDWDPKSDCSCMSCPKTGTVADFREENVQ